MNEPPTHTFGAADGFINVPHFAVDLCDQLGKRRRFAALHVLMVLIELADERGIVLASWDEFARECSPPTMAGRPLSIRSLRQLVLDFVGLNLVEPYPNPHQDPRQYKGDPDQFRLRLLWEIRGGRVHRLSPTPQPEGGEVSP